MFENESLEDHIGKFYGLYRGYVYDNKDPENLGRLRLCIPAIYGEFDEDEPIVSDWAYPMFPVSGNKWGIHCIPRIKNPDGSHVMVWVAFEMGDPDFPVWLGSPIPEGGLSKEVQSNQAKVNKGKSVESVIALTSPRGSKVVLNDEEQSVTISSNNKNGDVCTIKCDSKNGIVKVETDTNTLILSKGGVKVNTDKDFIINANSGNVVINTKDNNTTF